MLRVFNKPGQSKLYGSIDYLVDFIEVNKLLLSSYSDIETIYPDQSLGAFFFKNSVQIMSYEESQERQKDFKDFYIEFGDSRTEGKSGMFRFFIYNDKNYHFEQDLESTALITDFPGLLRYTNNFYHDNETKAVKVGDKLVIPKVNYNNEYEINIKEIDEKIGWNLFCDALNLKLDFYYLKTKSTLELYFLSICKDLIAVRIENWTSIDPFINTNIKLVDRKIVKLDLMRVAVLNLLHNYLSLKMKYFQLWNIILIIILL